MAKRQYRLISAIVVSILLSIVPVALGGEETQRSGWLQLDLAQTTIADTTVYYEPVLEPNLPAFEQELMKALRQRGDQQRILGRADAIIADIDHILGLADDNSDLRKEVLHKFVSPFVSIDFTFYLVTTRTIIDFLHDGGQLPDVTLDPESDSTVYEPQVYWGSDQEPPERFELCIPVASDRSFAEEVSDKIRFVEMFSGGLGAGGAIHEIAEMTLTRRMPSSDPYERWFNEGCANAIARHLLEQYLGKRAAAGFAAAFATEPYHDLESQINLRYWMRNTFCPCGNDALRDIEYEDRILNARYAYATFEVGRLVEAHGMDCIHRILDEYSSRPAHNSHEFADAIQDVTGEDMERRLDRYQTFESKADGVLKYAPVLQEALAKKNYAQLLTNGLRMIEVQGDIFTQNHLGGCEKIAFSLFKTGHEEAGDAAMRHVIELYSTPGVPALRHAASEMFVLYAIECEDPGKAEKEADELLQINPDLPSCLTAKMMIRLQAQDIAGAREIAERLRGVAVTGSGYGQMAAHVLTMDPNESNAEGLVP